MHNPTADCVRRLPGDRSIVKMMLYAHLDKHRLDRQTFYGRSEVQTWQLLGEGEHTVQVELQASRY